MNYYIIILCIFTILFLFTCFYTKQEHFGSISSPPVVGGSGGNQQQFMCDVGSHVTSIIGRSGGRVDNIKVKCSNGKESPAYGGGGGNQWTESNLNGFSGANVRSGANIDNIHFIDNNKQNMGTPHGGNGGSPSRIMCPDNSVINGINIRSGKLVDSIGFYCFSLPPQIKNEILSNDSSLSIPPIVGGNAGIDGQFECDAGSYVTEIYGRSGSNLDNIKVKCDNGKESNGFGGSGGGNWKESSLGGFIGANIISGQSIDNIQFIDNNKQHIGTPHGGTNGRPSSIMCADGSLINGLNVKSIGMVNSIGFKCANISSFNNTC